MTIDLKRTKDRERLRQVAILQDAEIRRLHGKLQALARENAALKGLSGEALDAQLRLIEKELADAASRPPGGSERRPRPYGESDAPPKARRRDTVLILKPAFR